jgi:hypothetical protein
MRIPYDQLTDDQIRIADAIAVVDPRTGVEKWVHHDPARVRLNGAASNGTQLLQVELAGDEARNTALCERVAKIKHAQLDQSAMELARKHYQVEPGLTRVIQFSASATLATAEPIKLLEVNANSASVGVMPLGFGPAPDAGIRFPSIIIEVTPEEFEKIEAKELGLPPGWEFIRQDIPRSSDAAEEQ